MVRERHSTPDQSDTAKANDPRQRHPEADPEGPQLDPNTVSKLKCAICRFEKPTEGQPQTHTLRNAEYIWEGVSVCEPHMMARHAQVLLSAQQQNQQQLVKP